MDDLKESYKENRDAVIKARDKLKKDLNQIQSLMLQKMGKLTLPTTFQKEREEIEREIAGMESDIKTMGEMISSMSYIIEWLDKGKRPGKRRGIERRSAYQREKLMDPLKMQAFYKKGTTSNSRLSEWQVFQIQDALSRLSNRERECYVMAHGECFSYSEIGEMLGISKSTVEEYVKRGQEKISEDLNKSLFLFG